MLAHNAKGIFIPVPFMCSSFGDSQHLNAGIHCSIIIQSLPFSNPEGGDFTLNAPVNEGVHFSTEVLIANAIHSKRPQKEV